ncbi:APC family permease [Mycolicibacterium diernhoferi]|uniref:APC family permease n=1 Tax=Mycolicibacterium diernhoferi TaxID=1801 RepID=A0A1Q4HEX9_9MYCO|nr:APC family permease [Mycolicibacterium diernhoferi]OJZ66109.1 amino acid permease [Mycolicibacterium diernhoferi]OPE55577.1 amino acid permease [Mycolicibacterium diernhoferi]PEG54531.1 APC family permease [Mycolicibacterium diernhoferi]QYL24021.1 APC family permease [Mycolicibacterium diernhoferi]
MTEAVNTGDKRSDTKPPDTRGHLRGNLGVPAIVLMVVAAAAPLSTVGGNVPIAMALGDTTGIPVAFLVAGAIFLLFAASFVAMSKYVSDTGAFYAYIQKGLGKAVGTGAAVLALPAYMATLLAVAAYDGVILSSLLEIVGGPALPWWVLTGVVLLVIAFLGYRDIDLSAKVLGIFLVSEVAILVVLDLVIVLQGGDKGITGDSFSPSGISGAFGIALLYALWGFVGVEATAVFRDEARDPDRTVPRATYWAVGIVATFYAFSSWALVEGNGGNDAIQVAKDDPDNYMVNTAEKYLGILGKDLTTLFWFVSVFACALAFHNIAARYTFVLGRDNVLPRKLGEVHPKLGSPANASVLVSVLSLVIMGVFVVLGLDPVLQIFGPLGGLGIWGLSILWLLTTISAAIFFKRRGGPTKIIVLSVVAAIVLAAAVALIIANLTLVVGGSTTLAVIFGIAPVVFLAIGATLSGRAPADLSVPKS